MGLNPALAALVKNAKNKYSRQNNRTVKLKEGKTTVRILQQPGEDQFWRDLGVHWIKFEKEGKPVAVVGDCDTVYGRPSQINAAIEKAAKAAVDDDTLKIIKDWKARKSVLVDAIIRSGPDASEDPQILEITPTTFSTVLSIMDEYGDEFGNILDLEKGLDLVIERKGKGLDTEYTVMPAPKSKPVSTAVLAKWQNLDEFIEREFFRGEETKALTAIASWTGLDLTGIGGPSATAARLSAPVAGAMPSADMTPELLTPKAAAPAPAPKAAAPAPAAAAAAPTSAAAAKLAAARAAAALAIAEAEAAAEAEALEAAAAEENAAAPVAAAEAGVPEDEINSILSDLDGLV